MTRARLVIKMRPGACVVPDGFNAMLGRYLTALKGPVPEHVAGSLDAWASWLLRQAVGPGNPLSGYLPECGDDLLIPGQPGRLEVVR